MVTREDLSKAFGGMRELPKAPVAALKASIHCECSLALAFAKSRMSSTVPTSLVIGISKSVCWLCHEFLVTFHDSYPHITIHVPPCTGKLRSGWTLPPEAPSAVVQAMRNWLQDIINIVLTESDSDSCVDDSSDESWIQYSSDDSSDDSSDEFLISHFSDEFWINDYSDDSSDKEIL